MRVVVSIVACSVAGEVALKKYLVEKLTLRERVMAKSVGLSVNRRVGSVTPFCVVTEMVMVGVSAKVVGGDFSYWKRENAEVVRVKMLQFGAEPSDYKVSVVKYD